MSPGPAVAAAAKAGAEHQAQHEAKKENDDELIPVEHYESESSDTTTYKQSSGLGLGSGSNHEMQIVMLLIVAGVIIFIQHNNSGKEQNGVQYAALGVVGFVLLVLAQFWPDLAFAFTILFVLAVILNSPNGIPIVGQNVVPSQPGQVGFGAAAPGVTVNQVTGQANPKG